MKKATLLYYFLLLTGILQAQNEITWKLSVAPIDDTSAYLTYQANMEEGWHLYAQEFEGDGPLKLKFNYEGLPPEVKILSEATTTAKLHHADDQYFGKIAYYNDEAIFKQKISFPAKEELVVEGVITGQICLDDGQCIPLDEPFSFELNGAEKATQNVGEQTNLPIWHTSPKESTVSDTEQSYWTIFFLAFLGGLAALFTPCVFPMIPLTVSYFTKGGKDKKSGIRKALFYGLSIVVIYVILGSIVTKLLGADSLNILSTNPWFNLAFFALLMIFGISFLGFFEITLPSSWANAADKQADKGGLIGIFFMAFALAIVSFSCTGPIVGTLLVQAASKGGLAPVIGMVGFSTAIALPFSLFAVFPSMMKSLPSSGGWLNSVKVVLGFIEIAAALKFLSVVDMALDLQLIQRELFIGIWVFFSLAIGFYLLGLFKMPHDTPVKKKGPVRIGFAILFIAFGLYISPGVLGKPVDLISGFPPAQEYGKELVYEDVELAAGQHAGPGGIPAFHDYEEGLAYAAKVKKPVLLDFTGIGCVNCRKIEDIVWSNPAIKNMLAKDYVLLSLYVDDNNTKLNDSEVYISPSTNKKVRTIGNKWSDFQMTRFNKNSQPYYVILDENRNQIGTDRAYDTSVEGYKKWLEEGIEAYKNR